jgi:alkylation response protein AidB-like acyl-CoA dehydrogenase
VSVLMTRVVGLDALPDQREALLVGSDVPALGDDLALIAMPYYLNSRAASIYAGTNEVQRDLIARTLTPVERR